jgi:hypothetical protein
MRRVLFSVCLGGYDNPPPLRKPKGIECLMFTDDPKLHCEGWTKVVVPATDDPVLESRKIKLCPHRYFDADVYIYMDASHTVKDDLNTLVKMAFKGGFTAFRHPARNCAYEEVEAIIRNNRAPKADVRRHIAAYEAEGLPRGSGLFLNGFFIRDNSFNDFCEHWLKEVETHSRRDQLSLAYLVWKYKPQLTVVDHEIRKNYLGVLPHTGAQGKPQIWYFVPGAGDKNLGAALNRHCELVPSDDDWILIRDNDTAFLHPFINRQLEDIVERHGRDYHLFSCYTNRIGLDHQLPYGLSANPDILHHRVLAEKHYAEHYAEVITSSKPLAGLFMLFQKKTWRAHPFEQGLADGDFIDFRFSNGLLKKGYRLGICTGIYMLHYYRMHQKDQREHQHLLA